MITQGFTLSASTFHRACVYRKKPAHLPGVDGLVCSHATPRSLTLSSSDLQDCPGQLDPILLNQPWHCQSCEGDCNISTWEADMGKGRLTEVSYLGTSHSNFCSLAKKGVMLDTKEPLHCLQFFKDSRILVPG